MNLTARSILSDNFIDEIVGKTQLFSGDFFGGKDNDEFKIFLTTEERSICGRKFFSVDFNYKNLIIEIYGDYWHANPKIYNSDEKPISFYPEKTAKDIWDYDTKRKEILESVKRGEKVYEKINHHELVLINVENIKKQIEKKMIEKNADKKRIESEIKNKKMNMRIIKKI